MLPVPEWVHDAACGFATRHLFFPPVTDTYRPGRPRKPKVDPYAKARLICARCPVAEKCLEIALRDPISEQHGMWGGLDPDERRALIRARDRHAARRAS